MKAILLLSCMFLLTTVQAQQINSTLQGYQFRDADLVILPFGMDKPVKIGTIDAQGSLKIDLSDIQLPELSEERKNMYNTDLCFAFSLQCGNPGDFGTLGTMKSIKGGNIALWIKNKWAGTFYLVSDEALQPWLEDEAYNEAVKGSFWSIIYVEEDARIDLNCTNSFYLESGEAEVHYSYNIELKKGFNWIQYNIEEIYQTNPNEKAPFPSKVMVSNLNDPDSIKLIVKYF